MHSSEYSVSITKNLVKSSRLSYLYVLLRAKICFIWAVINPWTFFNRKSLGACFNLIAWIRIVGISNFLWGIWVLWDLVVQSTYFIEADSTYFRSSWIIIYLAALNKNLTDIDVLGLFSKMNKDEIWFHQNAYF